MTNTKLTHPLYRASLPYQHAFDFIAAHTASSPLLIATHPLYVNEIGKRLHHLSLSVLVDGDWTTERISDVEYTPHIVERIPDNAVDTLIWAEPDATTIVEVGPQVLQHTRGCRHLLIMTSNWLARPLPEWRQDRLCHEPLGTRWAARWLKRNGYSLQASYGFNAARAIMWGRLHLLANRIGNDAASDRALAKMRQTYTQAGKMRHLSSVTVYLATCTEQRP